MAGGKKPVVFLLGPSGAGKSTLSGWLAEDAFLFHLEIDPFPTGDGIDAAGLRAEWDSFLSGKSAGPLVAAILHKAASARAAGAVLSFPSRLLLSINQLSELRRAGVT